jgi:hypothetical protein
MPFSKLNMFSLSCRVTMLFNGATISLLPRIRPYLHISLTLNAIRVLYFCQLSSASSLPPFSFPSPVSAALCGLFVSVHDLFLTLYISGSKSIFTSCCFLVGRPSASCSSACSGHRCGRPHRRCQDSFSQQRGTIANIFVCAISYSACLLAAYSANLIRALALQAHPHVLSSILFFPTLLTHRTPGTDMIP